MQHPTDGMVDANELLRAIFEDLELYDLLFKDGHEEYERVHLKLNLHPPPPHNNGMDLFCNETGPRSYFPTRHKEERKRNGVKKCSVKWTAQQDDALEKAVRWVEREESARSKWNRVASEVGTKSAKQCLRRWRDHKDPLLSKDRLSHEEVEAGMRFLEENWLSKTKWADLGRSLVPPRSANLVKNAFSGRERKRRLEFF